MNRLQVPLLATALSVLPGAGAIAADEAAPAFTPAELLSLSASVLMIEAMNDSSYSIGSGVAVAGDKVITNCHVTRDASVIHVLRGGTRWRVEAQAAAPALDLCMLRVPQLQAEPVVRGSADRLSVGEPLAALGYPRGVMRARLGTVFALYPHAGSVVIRTTTGFTSGASGGGLFDRDRRLVGILTFTLRDSESHYFAAPVEWIAPLMIDGPQYMPVRPLPANARAYWEAPENTRPSFLRCLALEQRQHPAPPASPCSLEKPE